MMFTRQFAAIAAAFFTSAAAAQTTTYSTANIASGAAPNATFTATGGNLVIKNRWNVTGVGVTGGRTSDEIDIGERITATFAESVYVTSIRLAFLYDGPEFNDVQERAQITATFADLSTVSYQLTAVYPNSNSWTGLGSVTGPALTTDSSGGFWTLNNAFGDRAIRSLSFTALQGVCGSGACNNQSDFALASISTAPIPEPETYALMLLGLAGVGAHVRRRKAER